MEKGNVRLVNANKLSPLFAAKNSFVSSLHLPPSLSPLPYAVLKAEPCFLSVIASIEHFASWVHSSPLWVNLRWAWSASSCSSPSSG